MKFFLGLYRHTHIELLKVPFMMSAIRLVGRKKTIWGKEWYLDSGGFTALERKGCYEITEDQYLHIVHHYRPTLAFCQDWMCEPRILKKTGLSVKEHQKRTIESYLSLIKESDLITPVIQGYDVVDYLKHARMYDEAGVAMDQIFGVGTVCRRSSEEAPERVIFALKDRYPDIKLHAFGLKITAFKNPIVVNNLYSADSMAWCQAGRYVSSNSICVRCDNLRCSDCHVFARMWLDKVLNQIEETKKNSEVEDCIEYLYIKRNRYEERAICSHPLQE